MKFQSNSLPPPGQSSLGSSDFSDVKRRAEKIRLLGWLNVGLSALVVSVSPAIVPALIIACFWILAVFGITQAAAWRLDKKAAERVRRP
jgi:hypothetical protein